MPTRHHVPVQCRRLSLPSFIPFFLLHATLRPVQALPQRAPLPSVVNLPPRRVACESEQVILPNGLDATREEPRLQAHPWTCFQADCTGHGHGHAYNQAHPWTLSTTTPLSLRCIITWKSCTCKDSLGETQAISCTFWSRHSNQPTIIHSQHVPLQPVPCARISTLLRGLQACFNLY